MDEFHQLHSFSLVRYKIMLILLIGILSLTCNGIQILIRVGVYFTSSPDKNLLPEPVIIAQVLSTPSVNENSDIVYTTATNELRINGTGFIGAKKVSSIYMYTSLITAN